MLFSTRTQVEEKKKNGTRAATHTNYRVLWVLLGLVAALTAGFSYLIFAILRLVEIHRRDGDRLKDMMRVRLYEQQDEKH